MLVAGPVPHTIHKQTNVKILNNRYGIRSNGARSNGWLVRSLFHLSSMHLCILIPTTGHRQHNPLRASILLKLAVTWSLPFYLHEMRKQCNLHHLSEQKRPTIFQSRPNGEEKKKRIGEKWPKEAPWNKTRRKNG